MVLQKCDEWLKLGLQGISVFFASGNDGVGDLSKPNVPNGCLRNDTVVSPSQTNTRPWLTSVGATKIVPGRTVYEPDGVAYQPDCYFPYSPGGGLSKIFGIPDYQSRTVEGYLDDSDPGYPYYHDVRGSLPYVEKSSNLYAIGKLAEYYRNLQPKQKRIF